MKTQDTLITDNQSLTKVTNEYGRKLPIYDDGYGPLFIHRDSTGINGVVRARTWEDAYSICEDEFFPEASETVEDLRAEYNFTRRRAKIIHPLDADGSILKNEEREDTQSDYANSGLKDGQFVRWETIETPSEDENAWTENELFQEAYGFRPNGRNSSDKVGHGIYAKDLNGDRLDVLTPALAQELSLTVEVAED
jgi:hypothetical protein